MRTLRPLAVLLAGAATPGCAAPWGAPPATGGAATGVAPKPYGIDLAPASAWVNPCEDFEGFACEGRPTPWTRMIRPGDLFANQPDLRARFADEVVAGQHQELLAKVPLLREHLARCRDPVARNAGLAELKRELDDIARATTLEEWARSLGHLRALGLRIFLDFTMVPLAADQEISALRVGLMGPILPYRFYKPLHWTVRENNAHWQRLAKLSGLATAQEADDASRVDRWLALARPARPGVVGRGPLTRSDLERWRFPWTAYIQGLGIPVDGPFVLDEPGDLDTLLTSPIQSGSHCERVASEGRASPCSLVRRPGSTRRRCSSRT